MGRCSKLFRRLIVVAFIATDAYATENDATYDLQLEDLLGASVSSTSKKARTQVTLASKKSQSLVTTAAATYVISHEDIKRSGVTNLPDALRLAPGLEVMRIDSNKWAVSARGFNGRFANKLLVLIDGRNIYTQSFSGVFWENQDVLLEDVERIEIIRGPGAALWGANAVNGVINVITKHSADTQKSQLIAGGGTLEQGFGSYRYGAALGKDTTARFFVKGHHRGGFEHSDGSDANDSWYQAQGGFRLDSMLTEKDALTVTGDVFHSEINQNTTISTLMAPNYWDRVDEQVHVYGGNLLGRLQHTLSATSDFTLQSFYSNYNKNEIIDHKSLQTADIDFQHRFSWMEWQDIIWGLNYRLMDVTNRATRPDFFNFIPNTRTVHFFSAFIQDEMILVDNELWLTLGSKFEHNPYSGFEYQPTIRMMWSPVKKQYFWGAFSRAVRTPSTVDEDLRFRGVVFPPRIGSNITPFPSVGILNGSKSFKAEELLAYEFGYRTHFFNSISFDLAAFYNQYHSLRSIADEITTSFEGNRLIFDSRWTNGASAETYGIETSTTWQMLENWRWEFNYSFINSQYHSNAKYVEEDPAQHKISLRSSINLVPDINLDFWLRYTSDSAAPYSTADVLQMTGGQIRNYPIPSYLTLDIRFGWKVNSQLEFSLTGQNLLDNKHLEFFQEILTAPTEIDRSVYGKVVWQF